MTELTLKAKHDHLAKVAVSKDPVKALAEFVWNALDADAEKVSVDLLRNPMGGLQSIVIQDDGSGISKERADHDFESLGDSWKRTAMRTARGSRVVHGKEGQGRLKFYSLAGQANWQTIYSDGGVLCKLAIRIDAHRLHRSTVTEPERIDRIERTGTTLELSPLKETFDWLTSEEARTDFGSIFAPYILQYPEVEIYYDGHLVDPNLTIERSEEFEKQSIVCQNRIVRDVAIRVIEWKSKGGSRKIHFGGEAGVVLGSQPANITAPDFEFSVYAYSPFFEELANSNLLEIEGLTDPDFIRVLEHVRDKVGDYFRQRQAEKSGELIQNLIDAGIYPYDGAPKDEVEKREREVFAIATHAVS